MSEIKHLFKENRELCVSEIHNRVNSDRGLIEHAIEQLVAKGFIVEVNYKTECRGCSMNCSARGERAYRLADSL
ncbi:MAG TPA: FeoC-like transcriptional regulator [Spirochaetota bacterium]|nr:FeoC-like transcriptional regulator [Spirochaetota bacterium]